MSSPVNRRMKLLILALLTAILGLTAAIVSLAMQGRENNAALPDSDTDRSTVSLYVQNGLWGIRTNSGRQITEPLWSNLRVMSDTVLIARESKGTQRLYGLIDNKGETLVPFVYSDFAWQDDCKLWIATLQEPENDQTVYHLYNSNGTLCTLNAWDICTCENGVLTLTVGANTCTAVHSGYGLAYKSWYSEHTVGLRRLTMELNEQQLAMLQSAETINALGDAAAAFLSYLLVSPDTPPDASLIGSENPSSLLIGSRYTGYRLQSAYVSRLVPIKTTGFPAYRIQMQVQYVPLESSSTDTSITTAMILTISQNANGAFVYTSFSDIQAGSTEAAHTQNRLPAAETLT